MLMEGGRNPDEPAAFVCSASTREQRVVETTLGSAARDAVEKDVKAPSIFVVGEIVRLRPALDWMGAMDGRVLDPDPLGQGIDIPQAGNG
jgi:uroporphyrin-III C-methyltransferase